MTEPVMKKPLAKKASLRKGFVRFIVETIVVSIAVVVLCWLLFDPGQDRFSSDNAIGATANALERLETKVVSIFAFVLSWYLYRQVRKSWDSVTK